VKGITFEFIVVARGAVRRATPSLILGANLWNVQVRGGPRLQNIDFREFGWKISGMTVLRAATKNRKGRERLAPEFAAFLILLFQL
jgi:hypothetical protein